MTRQLSSPLKTAQDRVARRGTSVRIAIGSEAVGSLPHSYASKCAGRETKARYYMQYEQPLGEGARRRRRMDVPRRGTLLRNGQYDNCAKRYSVSSSEANSRDLCLTRMRVNAYAEKRKHGITCNTSSPLEKGRAEGAGWMCLEEAPFYAATSMTTVQSATPYRQRKRIRGIFASLVCDEMSRLRNESTVLHMIRVGP